MKPPIPSPFIEPPIEETPIFPEPLEGDVICLRYKSTLPRLWRAFFRSLYLIPTNPLLLTAGAFVMTVAYPLPLPFAVRFIGNTLLVLFIHILLAWQRFRVITQSRQGTITCLTREGVHEIEPDKTTQYRWPQIIALLRIKGDLYFVRWDRLISISHEAFQSPKEAEQFYEITQQLRKSRGAHWPNDGASLQFGHWPAPQ